MDRLYRGWTARQIQAATVLRSHSDPFCPTDCALSIVPASTLSGWSKVVAENYLDLAAEAFIRRATGKGVRRTP